MELTNKEWGFISTTFFLAELLTFAVMGWLIYQVGNTQNAQISFHNAYELAAVAPIPLWLSALALLVPSVMAWGILLMLVWTLQDTSVLRSGAITSLRRNFYIHFNYILFKVN